MKNYNVAALRGEEITDAEHASTIGIEVPDDILNTPKYNDYVLDKVYQDNIGHLQTENNPLTGQRYTFEEATQKAEEYRRSAKENINALMKG